MPFRIYIETTIPSFYFEQRPEAEMVARRRWTRKWWDELRHVHAVYSSELVAAELRNGDFPFKAEKIALLDSIPLFEHAQELNSIAATYMERFLMPSKATADAFHMAFASYYNCDILLTWNCAHLANASKRKHLAAINAELGLPIPDVITPLELLDEKPSYG
jgi:hypothetical protein